MSKLPTRGDIVSITWEWNDRYAAIFALKRLVKEVSEGNLPGQLDAQPYTGLPCVTVDVTKQQPNKAYLDEEGRLEIIEQEVFV